MPSDFLSQRYPTRASSWQLRTLELQFGNLPLLMGIVNVTPDSFSDGGEFSSTQAAVEHALSLVEQGADILDIGGESTRPYAEPVSVREELKRVVPVIEALAGKVAVPISVDTSKSDVARAAVEAGAEIINDVTALTADPAMLSLVSEFEVGVCAMHMQGTPQTMQDDPQYEDVVAEVCQYLEERLVALTNGGVEPARICLDPGIGFGKTHSHNLELMARCGELHLLGKPLLVGHSRKGFLAKIIGDTEADRTSATAGAAIALALRGVQVIRIHDVRPVREALQTYDAVGGFQSLDT